MRRIKGTDDYIIVFIQMEVYWSVKLNADGRISTITTNNNLLQYKGTWKGNASALTFSMSFTYHDGVRSFTLSIPPKTYLRPQVQTISHSPNGERRAQHDAAAPEDESAVMQLQFDDSTEAKPSQPDLTNIRGNLPESEKVGLEC